MKLLNLSQDFKLPEAAAIAFQAFTFNGGEPHIKLLLETPVDPTEEVLIAQRICCSNDMMLLLLATDAVKRAGWKRVSAFIPYFPAARQDRVMVPGEPLSVKVYAQLLNTQGYERVLVFDPHSDVAPALLDGASVFTNEPFVRRVWSALGAADACLVAPDAGAFKKVHALATKLGIHDVVSCEKTRDVRTGKLAGFRVHSEGLEGRHCLIVDDICDGGGTFLGIAQALRDKGAARVSLAVSHGIFSDGLDKFDGLLEGIYTTDSFRNLYHRAVHQVGLATLLADVFPRVEADHRPPMPSSGAVPAPVQADAPAHVAPGQPQGYSVEWLKALVETGGRVKYIFFWGHRPRKDGRIGESCFSQWWPQSFEVENTRYPTAEHWMMAGKARLFGDEAIREKILACGSPAEAKKLGRQVKGFDQAIWEAQRYRLVKEGNLHKFGQHADLLEYLLATGDRVLVEASPTDQVWGIGLAKTAPYAENPDTWKGLNLLGFALMEVREQLRLR